MATVNMFLIFRGVVLVVSVTVLSGRRIALMGLPFGLDLRLE